MAAPFQLPVSGNPGLDGGVKLSGWVAPTDYSDPYPQQIDILGRGGWQTHVTLADRDAIILERRSWDMIAGVSNDPTPANNKIYRLVRGSVDTNIMNNANWEEFGSGTGIFLPLAGGIMSGDIDMNNNDITNGGSNVIQFSTNRIIDPVGGQPSINYSLRELFDNGFNISANYNNRTLVTNTSIDRFNWQTGLFLANNGSTSANVQSRTLNDGGGSTVLDWANYTIGNSNWKYDADYSGSYTARSIPDVAYVGSLLGDYISKGGSNIINQSLGFWDITSSYHQNFGGGKILYGTNLMLMELAGTSYNNGFQRNTDEILSYGSAVGFKGITYAADYSANYTARSLVDKDYVDTSISTISGNFVLKTGDTMLGDLDFQNTYSVNNVKEMVNFGDFSTLDFTSWLDTRPTNPADHYNQVGFRQTFSNNVRGFMFEPDNWFNIRIGNFTGTPPYNSGFNILGSNEERLFSVSNGTVQFDNWSSFSGNHYMSDGTNGWTFGGLGGYEGLTYDNDYSATYVARSLVDKEYVDNAISGATYTSNNGITPTGNNFQLGGALIQNTSITGAFNLSLDIGEFSKTVNRDILRGTGVDSPSWDQMNQVNTTNATPTATTLFTTATDKSYTVELNVTATRTGGSAGTAGDAASYKRTFRVKNLGGTVTLGSVVDVYTDEDQTGWNLTAIVSGLNVQAQVTGATNNNIKWSIETNVVEGTFTP